MLQQKLNADKRNKGQNETGVNKLKDWINQELDFAFSHKEAKHHLDSLIEDRKVLSEQVSNLKLKLDKKISHSVRSHLECSFSELKTHMHYSFCFVIEFI